MYDYIDNITAEKIKLISNTTKQEIKYIVMKNLEEGRGIRSIAYDIRQKYKEFSLKRSKLIARTEVAGISNYGSLLGAIDAGYDQKDWVNQDDGRVRPTHVNMDLHPIIDILDEFTVGSSLMQYPGDINGQASEVIGCRCYLIFYKKDS